MKTYVLYHGGCMDGFGAAFAAWCHLGSDAVYIPVNYGQPVPEIPPGAPVWILDFSYPREVLEELKVTNPELVVIDHHATAQKELEGLSYCIFDMEHSGAVLTGMHFFPGCDGPDLLRYIEDRDLWRWKLPNSREVNAALRMRPKDFEAMAEICRGGSYAIERLAEEGKLILAMVKREVESQVRNHRMAWVRTESSYPRVDVYEALPAHRDMVPHPSYAEDGHFMTPVVNAALHISEVCERLLELYPHCQMAAAYFDRADGKRQWSLRSRPGFDCGSVARAFGGGGHAQAAGFTEGTEVTGLTRMTDAARHAEGGAK